VADIVTLWRESRGIHQDAGRDRVPVGSVWDMIDFVPRLLGAPIRGRGGWKYHSGALGGAPTAMIYAPYKGGARLLALYGTTLVDVTTVGSAAVAVGGGVVASNTNPLFHRDRVIIPAADGATAASIVTYNGTVFTGAAAPVSALKGRYGTVFKDRTILANAVGEETTVAFSKPGDPTVAWDALSLIRTSLPVTGLAAQRNQILAFHEGSVERIRGTSPPDSSASDPTGDMILDSLFDRAGCYDSRSIALWQDNVVFADGRGVHITDGAIVRNMVSQGGIESLWRWYFSGDPSRGAVVSLAAGIFRDLYIVTMRNVSGPPITFVCDIPTRQWYRLSNIDAAAFAFSLGASEKLWGGDVAAQRVVDLSAMYAPDRTVTQVDADGTAVLPVMETGWTRFGKGQEGLKRFNDVFLSFETGETSTVKAIRLSFLHSPASDSHYHTIEDIAHAADYKRDRVTLGTTLFGLGAKIEALVPTKDLRLYDMGVRMETLEEHRLT
jgi:hypothetical protein